MVGAVAKGDFSGGAYMFPEQKWSMTKQYNIMCTHSAVSDLHCYKTMYLQNVGRKTLTTPSWLICSFPTRG